MILSNLINERVHEAHYPFDPVFRALLEYRVTTIDLPDIRNPETERMVNVRHRNKQTPQLLQKLQRALTTCKHTSWLNKRNVTNTSKIYGLDEKKLTQQDLLDLYIYPDDHILDDHGMRTVTGPIFLDTRNGELAGICIRNTSYDLDFVKDAKYTFSNFGWFLHGYDLYNADDEITLVEGVFDAIAMRHFGYNAIAIGACQPQLEQLACLRHKFNKFLICFDNDLHGHYGAYCTSKLLSAPILIPNKKDVSCYFESKTSPQLTQIPQSEVRAMLVSEIADYNTSIDHGFVPQRPLPYNQ